MSWWRTLQSSYSAPDCKQCWHQNVRANLAEKQICWKFRGDIWPWAGFNNTVEWEEAPSLRKQDGEADLILPIGHTKVFLQTGNASISCVPLDMRRNLLY